MGECYSARMATLLVLLVPSVVLMVGIRYFAPAAPASEWEVSDNFGNPIMRDKAGRTRPLTDAEMMEYRGSRMEW